MKRFVRFAAWAIIQCGERRVRWALVNLELAYPEWTRAQRIRLVQVSLVNLGWNLIDFLRMQYWDAAKVREHIQIDGLVHLHRALEQGRGAILVVPHLGHFELGLQRLALAGVDCVVVERVLRNSRLHARVHALRARFGSQPVDRRGAAPTLSSALRKGRVVVLAIDQYSGRSGRVFVPFFGLRVPASVAPAVLALRHGAPVLTCCVVRDAADHHRGQVWPAIPTPRSGELRSDVERATGYYYAALEALIREHPEQWIWSYRRFRYSPDLGRDPYVLAGKSCAGDPPRGRRRQSATEV